MSARTGTARTGTRPAVKGATRDRIVESALQRFSERGTAAVSMRELADAADVTVPGLYYHFDSKAAIAREVYRARFGVDANPVPALRELPPGPVVTMIVDQAGQEFARLVADREFLRLMQREAVLGDVDALEVGSFLAVAWRERWHDTLARATDVAPGTDLTAAADCIATFLWGLFVEYLNTHDDTVTRRIDDLARLLSPALTASPT
jgi:AcrR family transcriptional regulator